MTLSGDKVEKKSSNLLCAYDEKMKRNEAPVNSLNILTGNLILCACYLCSFDSVLPEG